jgi:hypothetical protein
MTDTFRDLCAELAEALERLQKQSVTASHTQFVELSNGRHPIPLGNDILVQDLMTNNLLDRARAALAQEAVVPSDDDCDLLVVAIQALIRPEGVTHDLAAVDRGTVILRKWLARYSAPVQESADG